MHISTELVVLIGLVCTILGATFGYAKLRRECDDDIKQDAISDGELKANITYIRQGVEDIKVDLRVQQKRTDELSERVVRIEESAKQAHLRINEIQKL